MLYRDKINDGANNTENKDGSSSRYYLHIISSFAFISDFCRSRKHKDDNDQDRDREGKHKDRKERKRSSKSRSRSRSNDKHSRSRRNRSSDRKERDRDDRRGKRSRSRDRSRSHDRSHRDRDRNRDKDRDRDRDRDKRRSRSRSTEKGNEREKKRDAEVKGNVPSTASVPPTTVNAAIDEAQLLQEKDLLRRKKEIDDLTKDQRTVFVSQLVMKTNEKNIHDFFSQLGKVNDIIMIRDKFSGRHKGFAYVEMAELESIPNCLLLNGIVPDFQKFPILVKASEAEKNFMARKDVPPPPPSNASQRNNNANVVLGEIPDSRIYIGNLHVNITEEDLKAVVRQIGPVESVQIHRDEVGTSKGYAFVRFIKADDAMTAHSKLAGLELAGKAIKVGFVPESGGGVNAKDANASQAASANWKLDDDEGTGMQMNAQSRVMLMAKLGQAAGIQMPAVPAAAAHLMINNANTTVQTPGTTKAPPIGGVASICFVIRNMFDLEEERKNPAGWGDEIKEDVLDECAKYGRIDHCHVETKKSGGLVYLMFSSLNAAAQAAANLNGRWFAGKMITVSYMSTHDYKEMFSL